VKVYVRFKPSEVINGLFEERFEGGFLMGSGKVSGVSGHGFEGYLFGGVQSFE
jgi:hypothetical protein